MIAKLPEASYNQLSMSMLTLVSNPGSASRKYALFNGSTELADIHFEYFNGRIICTYTAGDKVELPDTNMTDIRQAVSYIMPLFRQYGAFKQDDSINRIGLRIVAPGGYFLKNHLANEETFHRLRKLNSQSPIHIGATLTELEQLASQFSGTPIICVSDSAFHSTKPDFAWNYGLPLEDSDRLDIKRFGFHGLSVESVVEQLRAADKLPSKLIVAHLGSGTNITAIQDGRSVDHTMGYSSFEGAIMATRSGSIDLAATQAIKSTFNYSDAELNSYLNLHSGLLGLGGNSDIRELLRRESNGDHRSSLALSTYTYSVRKAIGQMAATINGVDAIVFTGTVGERSSIIRSRVIEHLGYLGVELDSDRNNVHVTAVHPEVISPESASKQVYVAPAKEDTHLATYATNYNV